MKTISLLFLLISLTALTGIFCQETIVEGYVYEAGNGVYLKEVSITILNAETKAVEAESTSNDEGFFRLSLSPGSTTTIFVIKAKKEVFKDYEENIQLTTFEQEKMQYVKIPMVRQPGYIFELTLSEEREQADIAAVALDSARIEVYNNTTGILEADIPVHPSPTYNHTLKQGNHYTFLIRKKGFMNKLIDAYVNIEGCILCIDGVDDLNPGEPPVSDVLTAGNSMGTLLANLEMPRAAVGKRILVDNIYYDLGKATIRPDAASELDKVALFLRQNPHLTVELGSYTDSRGSDAFNLDLSEQRAQAAVAYLIERGGLSPLQITAQGYGETQLVNNCANGVDCPEAQHAENRRTELKITGFSEKNPFDSLKLPEILELEEKQRTLLEEVQNSEVLEVKSFEDLPEAIKKQIREQEARKNKKSGNQDA